MIRIALQVIAVSLVLFALFVSLIRALLPQVEGNTQQFLEYLQSNYQLDVELGQLQASWQAFGPVLYLNRLTIPEQPQLPFSLHVERTHFKIDFWQSLITLSPQLEDVRFSGVELTLKLDQLANIEADEGSNNDWLYALLLEQLERFSLRDMVIKFAQEDGLEPLHLSELNWKNVQGLHLGQGKLLLDQENTNAWLDLSIALEGDGYVPETISGQLYMAANELDVATWYQGKKSQQRVSGLLNFEMWSKIGERGIQDATLLWGPSWLSVDEHRFSVTGGSFEWRTDLNGWSLYSDGLEVFSDGQQWPKLGLSMLHQKHTNNTWGQIQKVDVSLFEPLIYSAAAIAPALAKQWSTFKPKGELAQVNWLHQPGLPLRFNLDVNDATWQATKGVPSIDGLSLHLSGDTSKATISLPEQSIMISQPLQFNQQISTKLFASTIDIHTDASTTKVASSSVALTSVGINLDAGFTLDMPVGQAAHLALYANATLNDVTKIGGYFPREAMGESLSNYLATALEKGNADDAQVLWHGEFQRYPYSDNSGVFQASFTLQDSRFKFSQEWPGVDELTLAALFEDKRMDLTVQNGMLDEIDASGAFIGIPSLDSKAQLVVKASLSSNGGKVTQLMNRSALKSSVGSTLNFLTLSGDLDASIDLLIPLTANAQQGHIQGQVLLDNNHLLVTQPGVAIEQLSGVIGFDSGHVFATGLDARLYGQPLNLGFDAKPMGRDYGVDVNLQGAWDLASLSQVLANPVDSYYQGELDWNGKLMVVLDDSGYRLQAHASSNLEGVELSFPKPFDKTIEQTMGMQLEVLGDNEQTSLSVKLGNIGEFWGGFGQGAGSAMRHYNLILGRQFKPGDSFAETGGQINAYLNQVKFDPWLALIQQFTQPPKEIAQHQGAEPIFPPLTQVNANIKKTQLLGQQVTGAQIKAYPRESDWHLDVDADQFKGQVTLYPDWYQQGLKVVAKELRLASFTSLEEGANVEQLDKPVHLPPLALDIDNLYYDERLFGHLVMQGTPQHDKYLVETMQLTGDVFSLKGAGRWDFVGDDRSEISFNLSAPDIEALSQLLNTTPGIKESSLDSQLLLQWDGAIYQPNLASLDGKATFELSKGYLSEVSDKGTRLFSLFSLDSIVRKLSLDFSDVFGKGFQYDKFSGTLNSKNGVVSTDNTVIDGTAGDLKVKGFTNLVNQQLGYDVRFSPAVASSVPTVVLLSTSAWNLGIGAFAITKVLEPVIEVITEIRFQIGGTLDKPTIKELGRKSKEIEIPEQILPKKPSKPAPAAPAPEASDLKPNVTPGDTGSVEQAKPMPPRSVDDRAQATPDELKGGSGG